MERLYRDGIMETATIGIKEPLSKKKLKTISEQVNISAIVTVYNLAESVRQIYVKLASVLEKEYKNFEIIFVDDGSTDDTLNILKNLHLSDRRLKVIKLRNKFGEAAALSAGLGYARGDVIVYITGRVRVNPADIPKLLDRLNDGNDLVVGWRYPRRDAKLNQSVSVLFNKIISKISKLKLHDINSGVFIARRDVLEKISFYGNLIDFVPVIAFKQGYKIAEVHIEQMSGSFRKSRYLNDYIRRMLDIITVMFITNYSKKPLHFLGFIGALFTVVGGSIDVYLFIYRLFGFGGIAGRPILLLGVLLLVVGIQMISIGLLGEMIIFTHARQMKEYNIEETRGC